MRGISGNVNTAHPRIDEFSMSLVLIGNWHDVSEGIIVESTALDAMEEDKTTTCEHIRVDLQAPKVDVGVYVPH